MALGGREMYCYRPNLGFSIKYFLLGVQVFFNFGAKSHMPIMRNSLQNTFARDSKTLKNNLKTFSHCYRNIMYRYIFYWMREGHS